MYGETTHRTSPYLLTWWGTRLHAVQHSWCPFIIASTEHIKHVVKLYLCSRSDTDGERREGRKTERQWIDRRERERERRGSWSFIGPPTDKAREWGTGVRCNIGWRSRAPCVAHKSSRFFSFSFDGIEVWNLLNSSQVFKNLSLRYLESGFSFPDTFCKMWTCSSPGGKCEKRLLEPLNLHGKH